MSKLIIIILISLSFALGIYVGTGIIPEKRINPIQGSSFHQSGEIRIIYWRDGLPIGTVDSCYKATLRNLDEADSITIESPEIFIFKWGENDNQFVRHALDKGWPLDKLIWNGVSIINPHLYPHPYQ